MGNLTTYVLDTSRGKPASDLKISLYKINDAELFPILVTNTNKEGKTDLPLIENGELSSGQYQIILDTSNYFRTQHMPVEAVPFLEQVVVRFGITDHSHDYLLPVYISPYGYSIYRAQLV